MTTTSHAADELIWAGTIAIDADGLRTEHFAGLHDGIPQSHCPRCSH